MLRFEFYHIHLSIGPLSGAADSDIALLSVSANPNTVLVHLMLPILIISKYSITLFQSLYIKGHYRKCKMHHIRTPSDTVRNG